MRSYGGNYQNAYKKAAVNTLDQSKLIVMLYDGAIKHTSIGIECMKAGDIEKTHNSLIKSKNIISELLHSLNEEKGGEIAKNLKSLYSFMYSQLIEANVSKDPKPAQDVLKMLRDLREAWIAIGSANKTAAPQQPQPGVGQPAKHINLKG